MTRAAMSRLRDERGFTLIELLVVCLTLGIVLTGLVNVFVSGSRAGADTDARLQAQQADRLSLDKLDYEARCASTATLVSGGAGVTLTFLPTCSHVAGAATVTWCVTGGVLTRFTGAACSGTGTPYARSITSPTPFSLPAPVSGSLPQLQISLSANASGRSSDGFSLTDTLTLRNAQRAA
jgi:prepilin-type N-terminal cleavage/methylation domain-containing protein